MAMSKQDQRLPSTAKPLLQRSAVSRTVHNLRHFAGWLRPALIVAALIGGWQGAVIFFSVPTWKLPSPSEIATELVRSHDLYLRHTWVTLTEVLLGFAIAMVTAMVLASLIGYYRSFHRVIYPLVIASQTIPIIVMAPLLLVWIGYGIAPKIVVVVLIAFFPIVVNTVDGFKAVDSDTVNMMRTLGASPWQVFTKLQIPTTLPFLFSGAKIAATFSVIGAVIGEWVGASAGLGYLTRVSVPLFFTTRSFGAVVVLALMGVSLFLGVTLLERWLLPWYHTEQLQRALKQK